MPSRDDDVFEPQYASQLPRDFHYDYPEGLDLRPTSSTHGNLVSMLVNNMRASWAVMSKRASSWDKIDQMLTGYIPVSAIERATSVDSRREPVPLVIPVTYASLQTHLTYLQAAFFREQTVFKYSARNPESVIGAKLLELVISSQSQRFKHALNLMYSFRDGLCYGFGATTHRWHSIQGRRRLRKKMSIVGYDGSKIDAGFAEQVENTSLFSGNEIINIDPRRAYPDPSVPLHMPQKGSYWGFMTRENRLDLLERERNGEMGLFNVKYLQGLGRTLSRFTTTGGASKDYNQYPYIDFTSSESNDVDVLWMYKKLVPSEWNLGDSDYPEMWIFGLAADQMVIAAAPLDLDHNTFPVAVNAPESDGYSNAPMARLEVSYGLNELANFLVNSHMAARKIANNRYLIDPSIANIEMAERSKEGGFIHLRKQAQGLPDRLQMAMLQVPFSDVTMNNMNEMGTVLALSNNLMGTTDAMQGIMRTGPERLTAEEARGTRTAALSKMEFLARTISQQAVQDVAYQVASQTIQFLEDSQYVQVVGRYVEDLSKQYNVQPGDMMRVNPHDLMIDFDVVVADGTIGGGEDVATASTVFQTIASNPELSQQFDVLRVGLDFFRALGFKNAEDYRRNQPAGMPMQIQPQVMPDSQIADQAQRGNIIPIGSAA